jgi:hypothetical protein
MKTFFEWNVMVMIKIVSIYVWDFSSKNSFYLTILNGYSLYLLYPNLIHKFFNSLLNIENIGLLFHPNDILIEASHSLIHYDIKSKRSKLKINFGPLFRKILISNLFLQKIKIILSL